MDTAAIIPALFPRRFGRGYPMAVRGEGVYLYDAQGKKYLDAAGGAAVVTIGHGVNAVVEAMAKQAHALAFVHSSQFHTAPAEELAEHLRRLAPGPLAQTARVYFTSGGSEATETALKLVRQYWLERDQPGRYRILSRWQSYHGSTLGALALSGNQRRRRPYAPLLAEFGHIAPCYCYRCPLGLEFPSCGVACADELEKALAADAERSVAGFILEPIVGATTGAVPPEGYLQRIREICDRHDILLIADEIMTGLGRTGRALAVDHWGVVPDLILLGKGIASGYAPLGAVVVAEKVWRALEQGSGGFEHGYTYQAHPVSVAAGLAVQRYIAERNLVEQCRRRGDSLAARLESLRELPFVGDIRGKGLLQTVEFVADKKTRAPFPPAERIAERLGEELCARGVLVYPMKGCADGWAGDHLLLAPPFVIEESELDTIASELGRALGSLRGGAGRGAHGAAL